MPISGVAVELRQVRAVQVLADQQHFGRAAAALGITQSTLSQSIRNLEAELGVSLFERTTRTVTITEPGRLFAEQSASAVTMLDKAVTGAQAAGRGEAGSLIIGLVGSALTPPVPALLRRYRVRYPGVSISVQESTTVEQAEQLLAGGIDIGFLRPPLPGPVASDLDLITVTRTPLMAALPREHQLARSPTVALRSLSGEPFVRTPRALGAGFHDHITTLCRRAGFEPDTVQEATQIGSVIGLVAAGFGISIVPAQPRPIAGVSLVPLSDHDAFVELSMATNSRRPLPPPARGLISLVEATVHPALKTPAD